MIAENEASGKDTAFHPRVTGAVSDLLTKVINFMWTIPASAHYIYLFIFVKSQGNGRLCKKFQVQGAQILRNEAYFVATPQ